VTRIWGWANGFVFGFTLARMLGGWYAAGPPSAFTGSATDFALIGVLSAVYAAWSLVFVAARRRRGVTPLALLPFTLGWCIAIGVLFLVVCPEPCVEGRFQDITAIGAIVLGSVASYVNVRIAAGWRKSRSNRTALLGGIAVIGLALAVEGLLAAR
jgi:hypothetical protein